MGALCLTCMPCLGEGSTDTDQPSPETRRQQQAEAAEKRQKQLDTKGIKDPEALRRKQQRQEEIEKRAELAGGSDNTNLKNAFIFYPDLL